MNMTIIEVLKLNLPFKRKNDKDFIRHDFRSLGGLTKEDLLAEDWLVDGDNKRLDKDPTGIEL